MLQPKKKVLLLHEAKNNQTIIKCLSANPVMKEYITVDNINDIKQNVNDNFISNMFEMYNSVILVFENWIISESGVVNGIDRGYRRIIQNILISFKDGSVNSDKNLHVLLIEESEAKYEDFRSKYESVNSTPYYQLRDGILPSVIHLLVNICSDRMEKEISKFYSFTLYKYCKRIYFLCVIFADFAADSFARKLIPSKNYIMLIFNSAYPNNTEI